MLLIKIEMIRLKRNPINKLKELFKAKSNWHLLIIFIVFAISGSLSVLLSEPIVKIIKIDEYINNYFLYQFIRILIIFPVYQFVLLLVGTLFGEFKYFWAFEKKMMMRLKKKSLDTKKPMH